MLTRPDKNLRWDVLEEHFNEACFLWTQWENALASPHHTLEELASGDESRLRAHLKALVVGGSRVAARLLLPALAGGDPEQLWTAGYALLIRGEDDHLEAVLQALMEASQDQRLPLIRALSLSERQGLSKHLQPLLRSADPELVAAAVEILSFRRSLSPEGFIQLYRHEAPQVRAAALRAARTPDLPDDTQAFQEALAAPQRSLCAVALRTGLLRNKRAALQACQRWLDMRDEAGRLARLALVLGGDRKQFDDLLRLLEVPDLCPDVLWALGFSGKVKAAEACLPWLYQPQFAALAAEAFCGITGLALTGPYRAATEKAAPDDGEETGSELSAGLEKPEPRAIERWWAESRQRFDREARYLGGRVFSWEALLEALRNAPMRRRPVLALELSIRTQGRWQVEVSDFSHVQLRQLEDAQAARGRFWTGPFSAQMLS